jgi:ubiquinone/menaquinone biosynthesis C-methylase UbiE
MFEELCCPICNGDFSVNKNALICTRCHRKFPHTGQVIDLWNPEFESDKLSRKFTRAELKFTDTLNKNLKINCQNKTTRAAAEFLIRENKESFAARKIDEKVLADLRLMLPKNLAKLKILDIGSGLGKEAEILKTWGATNIILTDISLGFLKSAVDTTHPGYGFRANAEKLPVKNRTFDLAIFGSTLHHIPHPYEALHEAMRVANMVAGFGEPSTMREIYGLIKRSGWNTEYGNLTTHRFNPDDLKSYLESSGFRAQIKTDFIWFPVKQLKNISDNRTLVNGFFLMLDALDTTLARYGHNITFAAKRNV